MKENGITLLHASETYGGNLTERTTHVRCGSSSHITTNDSLQIWGEIVDEIIRIVNFGFSTTVEGKLSNV